MAGWTSPKTWNSGDILTAADMDTYVRDNTTFLSSSTGATVATSQTTTSTTYADLATVGPTVTVTTGAHALVIVTCQLFNNGANNGSFMGFAVSGATTTAAADATALEYDQNANASNALRASAMYYVTVNAGSNTFTAKYRVTAGTGTFAARTITVIPLP